MALSNRYPWPYESWPICLVELQTESGNALPRGFAMLVYAHVFHWPAAVLESVGRKVVT